MKGRTGDVIYLFSLMLVYLTFNDCKAVVLQLGLKSQLFSGCDMFGDTEGGELLGQGSVQSFHVHLELR